MALSPELAFLRIGKAEADHTFELYLDFSCPHSKTLADNVGNWVLPALNANPDKLTMIIRPLAQPWHLSSTLLQEAALCVGILGGHDKWTAFVHDCFEQQDQFNDENMMKMTPNETRDRLAKMGAKHGIDEKKMRDMLVNKGHGGNAVTPMLIHCVHQARQQGVHYSPSVTLNGIYKPEIDSKCSEKDWKDLLNKLGIKA